MSLGSGLIFYTLVCTQELCVLDFPPSTKGTRRQLYDILLRGDAQGTPIYFPTSPAGRPPQSAITLHATSISSHLDVHV